jgi:hypothetical protein
MNVTVFHQQTDPEVSSFADAQDDTRWATRSFADAQDDTEQNTYVKKQNSIDIHYNLPKHDALEQIFISDTFF